MINYCRRCEENPKLPHRKYCLKCINFLAREKVKQAKAIKKLREERKKMKRKEKRENNYKTLSKKAWNIFASFLKKSQATFNGYFTCYTCEKVLPVEQAQAGHCFHKGNQRYRAIDFDPLHIRLQCGGCNCFSTTQTNIFQLKLTKELGIKKVEQMIWRRQHEPELTIDELKELINKYSENI